MATEHMTSHQHRIEALANREAARTNRLQPQRMEYMVLAQYHATLAVYEALYELLGDDSTLDFIKREIVNARI